MTEYSGGTTLITINRPKKLNALNQETINELHEAFKAADADENTKVIIVTGSGEKAFVAGADISEFADYSVEEGMHLAANGQKLLFDFVENLSTPVIAAVNGFALGGGLEFALACDYRVGTDSDLTKIGLPEVQLGLLPGGGGTQRLTKIVGIQKALEWMLTGKQIRPKQAKKAGVLDDCVPQSVLLKVAKEFAAKKKPQAKEPKLDKVSKLLESNPFGRNFILGLNYRF